MSAHSASLVQQPATAACVHCPFKSEAAAVAQRDVDGDRIGDACDPTDDGISALGGGGCGGANATPFGLVALLVVARLAIRRRRAS